MFKIFAIKDNGEIGGCLNPAHLKFIKREDAEEVANRYRTHFGKKYEVFATNSLGYIVNGR